MPWSLEERNSAWSSFWIQTDGPRLLLTSQEVVQPEETPRERKFQVENH
jgi:hypothetical protein